MRARTTAAAMLTLILATAPADAQGRGNALGNGRHTPAASAPASSSSGTQSGPTAIAVREFGAWLDDASLVEPGNGWISISLGRYQSPGGRQLDVPSVDGAFGWKPRIQFGVTLPYSRVSSVDGGQSSGRGDVYANAKISLLDRGPSERGPAFSMTPLVEILNAPDPAHGGRFFWGLPVSGELHTTGFRLYGSAGYFSRGVLFGSGAIEMPASARLVTTAALTWTRSLAHDAAADALGLSASRVDMTGAATYAVTSSLGVFGSVGRTVSKTDDNSATLMLNAGLSLSFDARTPTPPSRRP